jgi:hypothetical protein
MSATLPESLFIAAASGNVCRPGPHRREFGTRHDPVANAADALARHLHEVSGPQGRRAVPPKAAQLGQAATVAGAEDVTFPDPRAPGGSTRPVT